MAFSTLASFESGDLSNWTLISSTDNNTQVDNTKVVLVRENTGSPFGSQVIYALDGESFDTAEVPLVFSHDSETFGQDNRIRWWLNYPSSSNPVSNKHGPLIGGQQGSVEGYLFRVFGSGFQIIKQNSESEFTILESGDHSKGSTVYCEAEWLSSGELTFRLYQSNTYDTVTDSITVSDTTYSSSQFALYFTQPYNNTYGVEMDGFRAETISSTPSAPSDLTATLA